MEHMSILIVEEEAIIAADIANKIESMGFQVSGIALTADEAVAVARKMCPQLALMELNLSKKDVGLRTAKIIQQLCDHLPILFLSCDPATMGAIDRADLTGPYGCIQKPFDKRHLTAQIARVLKRNEACHIPEA